MYEIDHDPLMSDLRPDTLARRVERVLQTLLAAPSSCAACAKALCRHETVMSFVLGHRDRPCCLSCLAAATDRPAEELGLQLVSFIFSRECLRTGWSWSSLREPSCSWTRGIAGAERETVFSSSSAPAPSAPDSRWDAGDLSCGDLALELRTRLREMRPGQVLELIARDPAAPEDLPAWCNLTGHPLLLATPPVYHIRRRED